MNPAAPGPIPPLRPVPLQELRLRVDAQCWLVQQKLSELDSLMPVRGQIRARHHGSVLEVEGEAETIVNLCCDRCLQLYNLPLSASVHELLELAGAGVGEPDDDDLTALAGTVSPASRRTSRRQTSSRSLGKANPEPLLIEALDDRLDPRGDFDPERWLFEQLSLQLPVVNRCGADCPGPPLPQGDWPTSPGAKANANAARRGASQPGAAHFEDSRAPAPAPTGQRVALDASPGSGCAHTSSPVDGTPDATKLPAGCEATNGSRGESGGDPRPSQTPIDPRWAALRQLLP